ncbi:MAG: hypothetical protein P0Y65_14680 [Candidatus Devosia phytovorans]|uniref:DUF3137 domain-containing protein n=1 Tax=Candidatus Devosia phytovorans TaxID=3121372 RepID=A0AAJ5VRH4_9HYPH|nr:hypothetical protein [Devosia sp.]WEK03433.1 MAG: hypothetical protein P0Y65_14680 [Devosia sp.]
MTQADDNQARLASGLARDEILVLLREAEPRRMTNLAVSLNLSGGLFFMLLGRAPLQGSFLWPIVACIAAFMVWKLSNRLWRDIALASVAQPIGQAWGQSQFASGWGAVDIEKWIADLFSSEGKRFTAWESQGKHRDIAYRLNESTIWRRRHNQKRNEIFYLMQVEIAVPQSFAGTVELLPKSGLPTFIDDFFQKVSGDDMRRQPVDPGFDAVFDTMVSANASTDKLLTPGFRDAMLKLAARNPQSYLSGRFEHGRFNLRLPIPHLVFASASLLKPMEALLDDVDTLWWDLTIPHRLIDSLMGDHDGPLR